MDNDRALHENAMRLREALDDADTDICRLCKRLNPQHADCQHCQEHDARRKLIKECGG